MTFPQQIEGLPPELVAQGFRRHPSESLWYQWQEREGYKHPHWQMVKLPDGTKISRPVAEITKGVDVYCHAGWGDGLAPTPEMCEIWRYWWSDIGSGPRVKDCHVVKYEHTPDDYWRGPVLFL